MAASVDEVYDFCEFCRINHSQGGKHVYTKRHKERIHAALRRFGKKVKEAKSEMKKPTASSDSSLLEVKFWCYMCAAEILKHATDSRDGGVVLNYKGFIAHLLSPDHVKNTKSFLWMQKLDKNDIDKYTFTDEHWTKYEEVSNWAVEQFKMKTKKAFKERVVRMVLIEEQRQALLQPCMDSVRSEALSGKEGCHGDGDMIHASPMADTGTMEPLHRSVSPHGSRPRCRTTTHRGDHQSWVKSNCSMPSQPTQSTATTNRNEISSSRIGKESGSASLSPTVGRVRTVGVKSSGGLTVIKRKFSQDDGAEGNVHTGALPPWLQEDESDKRAVIGPTEEDWKKHLGLEKKRKLNPNRVGANFDRETPTSDQWLPSFGRVWTQGRRLQSRHDYKREDTRKHKPQKQQGFLKNH